MAAQFKYFKTNIHFEKRSGKDSLIVTLSKYRKDASINYCTYNLSNNKFLQDSNEVEFLEAYMIAKNKMNKILNL